MNRTRIALLALLLTVSQLGCDQSPLSPSERRQLALARVRWAQHGGPDYTVESRVSCFCPPEWSYWTRLTVRGGQVVQVEAAELFPFGLMPSISGWQTVEEIFTLIATPEPDVVRDMALKFDAQLGYPLEVRITCRQNILDCGSLREMRNLRIP